MSYHEELPTISNSRHKRQEYRRAVQRLLVKEQPEFMLTLAFNGPTYFESARAALRQFHAELDRYLVGPRWACKASERTWFMAFPEHSLSNFHYHLLLRFDCGERPSRKVVAEKAQSIWNRLVPSGTARLDRITFLPGIARYGTKELSRIGHIEEFILSTEFEPDVRLYEGERLRPDFVEWAEAMDFNWYIKLRMSDRVTEPYARVMLEKFRAELYSSIGQQHTPWNEIIAIAEREKSEMIYHLLIMVNPEAADSWVDEAVQKVCMEVLGCPSLMITWLAEPEIMRSVLNKLLRLPGFSSAMRLKPSAPYARKLKA